VKITADPDVVRAADRIVLPGVGSFKACAKGCVRSPAVAAMEERVLVGEAPFLGICVGMQLLATRGFEHGITQGWLDSGEVRLIERADPSSRSRIWDGTMWACNPTPADRGG
jgi:glutamine amidotransferase